MGDDKCILIDSGCGTGDYRSFVASNINKSNLPYLVINTHVHFDHIGGNHRFCGEHQEGCIGVCMGCQNKTFSQNYAINSLSMAHSYQVKPFAVTRWLNEGDLIYLNDAQPSRELAIEVIFLPGHTPDSIGLYASWEKRLFVGDILYPFTTIHVDGLGSNAADYLISLKKMQSFIERIESAPPSNTTNTPATAQSSSPSPSPSTTTNINASPTPAPTVSPSNQLADFQKAAIQEFLSVLSLDSATQRTFNAETLMSLCDWDVTTAIDFYLGSSSEISSLCPPSTSSTASSSTPQQPAQIVQNQSQATANKIVLSCGHVECNLDSNSVTEVVEFLELVKSGFVEPNSIDAEYGEYSNGNFALMLPLKPKWDQPTKPQ